MVGYSIALIRGCTLDGHNLRSQNAEQKDSLCEGGIIEGNSHSLHRGSGTCTIGDKDKGYQSHAQIITGIVLLSEPI